MEKGEARKERGGRKRIKNKEMGREKEVNTNKDDA
jgi:hypothetical protein